MDLAGERLVDSVLERAAVSSSAASLKRRSSSDMARQVGWCRAAMTSRPRAFYRRGFYGGFTSVCRCSLSSGILNMTCTAMLILASRVDTT